MSEDELREYLEKSVVLLFFAYIVSFLIFAASLFISGLLTSASFNWVFVVEAFVINRIFLKIVEAIA